MTMMTMTIERVRTVPARPPHPGRDLVEQLPPLRSQPGDDPATATRMQTAQQTIFHDQRYPSHITLPVIPR